MIQNTIITPDSKHSHYTWFKTQSLHLIQNTVITPDSKHSHYTWFKTQSLHLIQSTIITLDSKHNHYTWFKTQSLHLIQNTIITLDSKHNHYTWFKTQSLHLIQYTIIIPDSKHSHYTWFKTQSLQNTVITSHSKYLHYTQLKTQSLHLIQNTCPPCPWIHLWCGTPIKRSSPTHCMQCNTAAPEQLSGTLVPQTSTAVHPSKLKLQFLENKMTSKVSFIYMSKILIMNGLVDLSPTEGTLTMDTALPMVKPRNSSSPSEERRPTFTLSFAGHKTVEQASTAGILCRHPHSLQSRSGWGSLH